MSKLSRAFKRARKQLTGFADKAVDVAANPFSSRRVAHAVERTARGAARIGAQALDPSAGINAIAKNDPFRHMNSSHWRRIGLNVATFGTDEVRRGAGDLYSEIDPLGVRYRRDAIRKETAMVARQVEAEQRAEERIATDREQTMNRIKRRRSGLTGYSPSTYDRGGTIATSQIGVVGAAEVASKRLLGL